MTEEIIHKSEHFPTDRPAVPEVDVAFAISGTSVNNRETFALMKDTISWIIAEYGTENLRYSIILFGAYANIRLNFDGGVSNANALTKFVQSLPRTSGGPDLIGALKQAESAFESAGVRPEASKVLVVITDNASDVTEPDIERSATSLHEKGIKVVPVAVGSEADSSELEATNPERTVILAPNDESPEHLGRQIMTYVVSRKTVILKVLNLNIGNG